MKYIAFVLITIAVNQASGAENGPFWLGFKASDDAAIPETIRKASESVFQILYPHGEPEIKDVSSVDVKTMSTDDSEWFKIIQVKVCQNQKIKNCPIMPKLYSGTAFLAKDRQTIVTNLHNVQSWLYYAKKYNPELNVEDIQAPIILADSNQDLAFNPIQTEVTLKLSFYNKIPTIFSTEYPWEGGDLMVLFRVSDYVELHASIPSSRTPLQFGKIVDRSAPLYAVGFPNPTNIFSKFGGIDSPGYGRWTSVGKVQPTSILENLNFNTTNACAPGSSGSPLLNAKGEVVGILFAGGNGEADGTVKSDTQFLQTDLTLLKKVWSQFQ